MFGAVEGFGLPEWTLVFLASAALIVVAETVLARAGDGIARVTGLGGLAVGDLFGRTWRRWGRSPSSTSFIGACLAGVRLGQALVASVAIMLTTLVVQLALVYVPVLGPIFATVALTPLQLTIVLVVSTLGLVAVEIEKSVLRRHDRTVAAHTAHTEVLP